MKAPKHIAIEGPIGAGKTSLAKILAEELGSRLVLEKPEENPFLPDFYSDRKRWALQTQLTFLLTRHRQYMELSQMDLFQRAVVTDYIFDKDAIFARLTLNEREFDLYSRIAEQLAADIVTPDLVVYLQSSPERLLTNIRIRDIRYEREIDIEYLRELCESYNKFFSQWERSPLLVVRGIEIDFVNDLNQRRRLVEQVIGSQDGKMIFSLEE